MRKERAGWECDPAAQSCGYGLVCTVVGPSTGSNYFGCTYPCETDEDCDAIGIGQCEEVTTEMCERLGAECPTGWFCEGI